MLFSMFFSPAFAQEDTNPDDTIPTDEVTADTTTTDETTNDITTEEGDTTTTDETTDTTEDTEVTRLGYDDNDTSTIDIETTTSQETSGFLDGIDTMWLWVILGVGGIILIGSLIGIISLSKKEKGGDSSENIPDVSEPVVSKETTVESTIPTSTEQTPPPIQPVVHDIPPQSSVPPVVENKSEEIHTPTVQPVVEEAPSIKETLGDPASYQQPEVNGRVVSNTAPKTDINKDLADLNVMGNPQTIEPQISTIETATVKPEDIIPESPLPSPNSELDNRINTDLNVNQVSQQEPPISNSPQSQVDNQAINIMNSEPIPQASPTPSPENNPTINPLEVPIPTPEPITAPPVDISTSTPQTQEQTLGDENLSNQGLTQPIDTTSL